MDIKDALLDSWDRQCKILDAVALRVDESNRHAKPSEDGWPLDHQLAHIHGVRREWLSNVAPERAAKLGNAFVNSWDAPIQDLDAIRGHLKASAQGIREFMAEALQKDLVKVGGYDNPILFLQHMVWHEGWHVGLLFLGLRLAGQEPTDVWEEENVWGQWRVDEWETA